MQTRHNAFKRGRPAEWTKERIEQLGKQDIQQLRDNAERLGEPDIAALCIEVLKHRPRAGVKGDGPARPAAKGKRLTSRGKAFQARGVWLQDPRSWSGLRKSDGGVVMTLWASAVESGGGGCRCLLWAPNVDGARPWSDEPAGKERLEHAKLALERGGAEGLLVHGESLEGHLPEDKARSVHGVDPEAVVRFTVEKRGEEYWAVWGARKAD